jgi:hypothetical protein
MSLRRRVERDASGEEADGILRAPKRSAKHKMSRSPTAYGSMGQVKAKRGIQETRHRNSRLCVEADEKNFSFVNESPRRLLSRRAALESRDVAHCGRLR